MSLMCLFPWLDYGFDILDFGNFDFFVGQSIFTSLRADPAGQNGLSCNNEVNIHDHEISERYISKLSVGGF